jgi:hypothetical protein
MHRHNDRAHPPDKPVREQQRQQFRLVTEPLAAAALQLGSHQQQLIAASWQVYSRAMLRLVGATTLGSIH